MNIAQEVLLNTKKINLMASAEYYEKKLTNMKADETVAYWECFQLESTIAFIYDELSNIECELPAY